MDAKMQKFNLAKKKRNKRTRRFRRMQEKRKKIKATDDVEIEKLSARLWPNFDQPKEDIQPSDIKEFSILPISKSTLKGLDLHKFTSPTEIQRQSLMYGLKGFDILGAAKTGSGKTLAFLIPILETLFKQRYTPQFGMAALVISPTRELACQIYDVLNNIGQFHQLSYGLVIGGKNWEAEAGEMYSKNVVICTPGRLQQHFEQTPNFTADELKILVLDEADKILEMGFKDTLSAIIESLPTQRQTLLFSATQTKSVKALAQLSLKRPVYISAHEKAEETTPTALYQYYIICKMQNKISTLWSFIREYRHQKILVFLSCCKETRFIHQVFKKMHPGLTVLCLHGHMKLKQRMEMYNIFYRKQHAVLLATDVAARGLDFPVVQWVVQMDKPDNANTYIHRVGRTARYDKEGKALLMLLPAEEKKMMEELEKRKVSISKQCMKRKLFKDVTKKLENLCAADIELKSSAQKAFHAILRTLHKLDQESFESVDLEAFAGSLGLVKAPKLTFLDKMNQSSSKLTNDSKTKKDSMKEKELESDEDSESEDEGKSATSSKTLDFGVHSDDDDDDDIYTVVKDVKPPESSDDNEEKLDVAEERVSKKKKSLAKERLKLLKYATRITFDEEGKPENEESEDEDVRGLDINKAKERMKERDKEDKERERQRIKEKHREKRLKLKEKRRLAELEKRKASEEEPEVVLGSPDSDEDAYGEEENDREVAEEDDSEMAEDSSADEEEEEDSEDEGPKAKRQRLEENSDSSDAAASSDDEDDEEDDEEDDDNGTESDESEKDETAAIGKDEEVVLALLSNADRSVVKW